MYLHEGVMQGFGLMVCSPGQDAEVVAERIQALAASGLWEAVNLPPLREKPASKTEAKPKAAASTGVGGAFQIGLVAI